jgi:hypothetical protein
MFLYVYTHFLFNIYIMYLKYLVRHSETSTPERGEQEPGTTTRQLRAAADGYDIKNSKCYNNISETDEDAS